MQVWHMNGAGNDFMVIDARGISPDFSKLAQELCKKMDCDGFMAVDHSETADFKLHFYNSDGSRGEMCGNGARCICRFAYDMGIAGEEMTVETDAGLVPGWRIDENRYAVHLNLPSTVDLERLDDVAYVELGNPGIPHAVSECQADLWENAEKLRTWMEILRHHEAFPKGANVNFYQHLEGAPGEVRVLTFERGVEDFTLACGTGCGSTAVVLHKLGKLPGGVLTAHNRGGTLRVEITETEGHITTLRLEGPTEVVKIYEI